MSEREEKIRAKAYELWEAAGCPHGDDHRFWHEAEAMIATAVAAKPARATAVKSKPEKEATPTLVAAEAPKRTKKVAMPVEPATPPTLSAAGPSPTKARAVKSAKPAKTKSAAPLH